MNEDEKLNEVIKNMYEKYKDEFENIKKINKYKKDIDNVFDDPVFGFLTEERNEVKQLKCSICKEKYNIIVVFDYKKRKYVTSCLNCLKKIQFQDKIKGV